MKITMIEEIQEILKKYKDSQLNLHSKSARWQLAAEIARKLGGFEEGGKKV